MEFFNLKNILNNFSIYVICGVFSLQQRERESILLALILSHYFCWNKIPYRQYSIVRCNDMMFCSEKLTYQNPINGLQPTYIGTYVLYVPRAKYYFYYLVLYYVSCSTFMYKWQYDTGTDVLKASSIKLFMNQS